MNISGYRIDKQIGKGGMAMVYLAIQESLGRPVALKVMNPLFSDSEEFSERFLDEGRLLASLRHTHIVTIHDIGISQGFHFIAMEYVEGGDLRQKIEQGVGREQAVGYLVSLAECLGVAHDAHIVHRDIKPANILFRGDGTLLLTDFGIAKQLTDDRSRTRTGSLVGSPYYLSPEQAQGKPVDGRADIYSLGIIFYEMLAGVRPFQGDSDIDIALKHVTEALPPLPPSLAAYGRIVDTMTRKDPAERFPSCRSLLAALAELRVTGHWSGEVDPIALPEVPAVPSGRTATAPAVRRPPDANESSRDGAQAKRTILEGPPGADEVEQTIVESPSAVERTIVESRPEVSGDDSATLVDASPVPCVPDTHRRGDTRRRLYASVAAVAAIGIFLGWWQLDDARTGVPAPDANATTETAATDDVPAADAGTTAEQRSALERELREKLRKAQEQEIQRLLDEAAIALAADRLTTPEGTNAFAYYKAVLALDVDNVQAQEGLETIAARYHRLAKAAEQDWNYDAARVYVDRGLTVRPGDERLLQLHEQLLAADGKASTTVKNSLKDIKGWFD